MVRYALAVLLVSAASAQTRVPIVVDSPGAPEQRLAAAELSRYLSRVYAATFPVFGSTPVSGPRILIASVPARGSRPESFTITHSRDTAVIAGADARGTLYAVYALLEKLGCGFYLSFDALPPRPRAFRFDGWDLSDSPVTPHRIVFNWHNFLSSGSSWELEDWQRWIDQSAKMRFNTVMVHAYGNNPMFSFRYNGQEKPVGYLATTARGRDWGTQHVNDVRRLIGGDLFRDAVFGSTAAKVPEAERAPAAAALMKQVFAHARSRGMRVTFALDVDTESANPQNIIATLPASARIARGDFQLANPDTPEGYAYYRAQVRQLLEQYPQIDRLAVWFRAARTPWRDLKVSEFPPAWKAEFAALCRRDESLAPDKDAPGIFAIAKVARAFGKALREAGRPDVQLATGSWRLEFIRLADRFMPAEAAIIPLDWNTHFETDAARREIRDVQPGRKVIPILWAHHDDRTYIGRPYTPYANFASLLESSGAAGFGIIHWTTRPLDLYFKSLAGQVWTATVNQPLAETCRRMAARAFGAAAEATGAQYLERWVTEAPMFGRETGNRFMDVALHQPDTTIAQGRARLDLLARIDAAALAPEGRDCLDYFRDYERFMLSFYESQQALELASALARKGAVEDARRELSASRPEEAIRLYAQAARHGGITRGEQALIISLNLRWLPYVVSLRQALGLEPVRMRFAPTQHEPLAQGAGSNTFYVDKGGRLWKVSGEKETGAIAEAGGIRIERPLTITVGALAGDKLVPGRYSVELRFEPSRSLIEIGLPGQTLRAPVEPQRHSIDVSSGALHINLKPLGVPVRLASIVLTPALLPPGPAAHPDN